MNVRHFSEMGMEVWCRDYSEEYTNNVEECSLLYRCFCENIKSVAHLHQCVIRLGIGKNKNIRHLADDTTAVNKSEQDYECSSEDSWG